MSPPQKAVECPETVVWLSFLWCASVLPMLCRGKAILLLMVLLFMGHNTTALGKWVNFKLFSFILEINFLWLLHPKSKSQSHRVSEFNHVTKLPVLLSNFHFGSHWGIFEILKLGSRPMDICPNSQGDSQHLLK